MRERHERDIASDERKRRGAKVANIGLLEHAHARIGADSAMQLRAADIDTHDLLRALLQQDLGKAARAAADVEHLCWGCNLILSPSPRDEGE